jgi:hypothetical protein
VIRLLDARLCGPHCKRGTDEDTGKGKPLENKLACEPDGASPRSVVGAYFTPGTDVSRLALCWIVLAAHTGNPCQILRKTLFVRTTNRTPP